MPGLRHTYLINEDNPVTVLKQIADRPAGDPLCGRRGSKMRNRSIISQFLMRASGMEFQKSSSHKIQRVRRLSLFLEQFETRQLLTLPPTLTIPLVPELDQFGDQILIVQGFDLPERSALGIFDTGASAVTFAATDQEVFAGIEAGPIPIKVPGGAAAGGIGGEIVGDVSEPGIIYSDGMHAFDLSFDDFGFPQFNITLSPSAIETPGIQAFVGTESSPLLPTITGTPALQPSPKYPSGAAARISMQGAKIDFSDIFPDLIIPFPDLFYTNPGATIETDPNDTTVYEPFTLPLIPFGGDNFANPGDLITDTNLYLIPGITSVMDTVTSIPGNFLFDTGAQLSVISTDMALSLGLDLDNPTTSIDVQGVAGNETVPGFTITKLVIPRMDGGLLELTDVPIYVLDVAPGIDGIFGMNLLNVANEFIFDPHNADGPRLTIEYFANPDRGSGGIDIGGELAALLGGSLGAMFGSTGGSKIPSFNKPGTSALVSTTNIVVPTTPVEYGASFNISTKVNGPANAPVPTGKVDLSSNSTTFASLNLNASGQATWASPSVPWEVGSYSVKASYGGDSKFAGSTVFSSTFQVVKASTSLTLQSNSPQVTIGGQIQLSGKLTSSTGISTAASTIKILIDGKQAATTTVASNGSFSVNLPGDTAGTQTIQAVFEGSNHFKNSGSSSLSVQVNKLAANLALNLPTSPVEYGSNFSIKAVATGPADSAAPSGIVDLSNTSGKFASLSLDSSGAAIWQSPAAPWAVGSYTISAAYGGDSRFSGVTAPAATIQVVKAATTLTLASASTQIVFGSPVALSGKLASRTGAATSGAIVSILVDGKNSASATVGTDGSFALSLPGLIPGVHTIQAVFDGSSVFNGSSSQTANVEIAKATGDLTLTVPSKIVFGQKVQLVATLKSTNADAFKGASVVFYDGTKELGRSPVSDGAASFLLTASQTGKTFDFKAAIAESANTKLASSVNSSVVVNKADVAISWVALPPPRKGRPSPGWTVKITPTAPGAGSPTGSITLNLANKRAKPKVIALSNGSAVYKFTGTLNKPVKISYAGNTNFNSAIFNV